MCVERPRDKGAGSFGISEVHAWRKDRTPDFARKEDTQRQVKVVTQGGKARGAWPRLRLPRGGWLLPTPQGTAAKGPGAVSLEHPLLLHVLSV